MPTLPSFVVVTPARNEARFIELTIKSMLAQTRQPLKWVIVSDGSTDDTDNIVRKYTAAHQWIELVRMPEHADRQFAAKVSAFNAGYARIRHINYGAIAALDADISFDQDYFSFLLGKLAENPRLGLVGTPFAEDSVTYDYRFASIEHVSGACQLFRRECFEAIGGYVPIQSGGIDTVAVLSARMKGWQTRTFLDKVCHHHRKQGSATGRGLALIFNSGVKDYLFGVEPAWQILRAVYRLPKRPYVLGGVTLFLGYLWPLLLRRPKTAPKEVVTFLRQDQRARLCALLRNFWSACWTRRPRVESKLPERVMPGKS
jgi:poly-beta-1,6-N-acetyl-D-glucosamine synthase